MYNRFYPGKVWKDTEGKRIQAHGGSVFYENGKYYWYGENKEFTDGLNGIWHYGVRCYESEDLYNWKDLGLIIPPDNNDKTSPLHPSAKMDRPHIIFNQKTGKYVCWIKVMRENGQFSTVLTSDKLTGPYTIVHRDFRPLGMDAGDFDLAVAQDGKAYYYFERVHSEMICADLTEDYTDVTGYYSTHFPHPEGIPFVREGTSHFMRKGKHYLITSGTTGYLPNPSEAASADTWHGPYTVLGNPHIDDASNTSFHSQISSVFKVQGKSDLYIAMADRWRPDAVEFDYEIMSEAFAVLYGGSAAEAGRKDIENALQIIQKPENTSLADYVWLPITFQDGMPVILWKDEWSLDEFE